MDNPSSYPPSSSPITDSYQQQPMQQHFITAITAITTSTQCIHYLDFCRLT